MSACLEEHGMVFFTINDYHLPAELRADRVCSVYVENRSLAKARQLLADSS